MGGSFRVTFTNVLSGSYALGTAVTATAAVTQSGAANDVEENAVTSFTFGKVYPNPGNGRAFIPVASPKAQKLKVELVNVSGQALYAQQEQVAAGVNLISIPVQRYVAGTYMTRTRGEDGKTLNAQQ